MAKVIAAGLHGFVEQPDGTNIQTPVFLAVDLDTHQVLGYLDVADVPDDTPAPDAQPEGTGY